MHGAKRGMTRQIVTRKLLQRRSGLSLLEVVLALVIFLVAMVGINQLTSVGSRSALTAKWNTEAAIRAETKMNELVAGVVELESVEDELFSDADSDARWKWSLQVEPAEIEGLLDLTVTVTHLSGLGDVDLTYSLRRFMRDPQAILDAVEEANEQDADEATVQEGG